MSSAIDLYLDAYDAYQTRWAAERMNGWDGDIATGPGALFLLHGRMVEALADVYRSEAREKPNYVDRARERFCGCRENGELVHRAQCRIHGPGPR